MLQLLLTPVAFFALAVVCEGILRYDTSLEDGEGLYLIRLFESFLPEGDVNTDRIQSSM